MNILAKNVNTIFARHFVKGIDANTFRLLYTRKELGISHFENLRFAAQQSFQTDEDIDKYKSSMRQFFAELPLNEKRDELKKLIVLIDDNDLELELLKELLQAYNIEYSSTTHRVKPFTFGTIIMRLFYWRNSPDFALQFFNDKDLAGTFEQQETYKVLFDLLYKHQRYDDIYKLYEEKRKYIAKYGLKYDNTIDCLALASCYHLNTREHFDYAVKLWDNIQPHNISKRCKSFVAALALKQKQPNLALLLAEDYRKHVTPRFICLMAYTDLGEFDAALEILEHVIGKCSGSYRPTIGEQMIKDLEAAIKESGTDTQKDKFRKIAKKLKNLGLISDETLDYHLCKLFPEMPPKNTFRKSVKIRQGYEKDEEKIY